MSDPIETAIFEKPARADPGGVGGKSIEPADVAGLMVKVSHHRSFSHWEKVARSAG